MKEDFNKAKIKLEIPNFSDVLGKTTKGQRNSSKQIEVRGSKFALGVFPKGCGQAEKGMPSAFLYNESDHDVIVDFIIAVEGCNLESWKDTKIERKNSKGKIDFMRVSNMIDNDFIITVEFTVKWEEVSGEMANQNQVISSDLVKIEERFGDKVKKLEERLAKKMKQSEDRVKQAVISSEDRMEQKVKNIVRAEVAKVRVPLIPECPLPSLPGAAHATQEDCAVPEGRGGYSLL